MITCKQEHEGDRWRCCLCGRLYRVKAHRQCQAPRIVVIAEITRAITHARENNGDWHAYHPRPLIDLEKLIETCLDCDEFDGNTCKTRRGCTWRKMLGCVGFRKCPNWNRKEVSP